MLHFVSLQSSSAGQKLKRSEKIFQYCDTRCQPLQISCQFVEGSRLSLFFMLCSLEAQIQPFKTTSTINKGVGGLQSL